MSGSWLAISALVPMGLAVLVAWPFWRKGIGMYGSIVGTGLIFGAVLTFVLREAVAIEQLIAKCNLEGILCPIRPDRFTRFAIYGAIGMLQTFVLFALDLRALERRRRRDYGLEWRGR